MKLHKEHIEIERSNLTNETAFRIKTSAHAFDILSSGLYTDNVLAVVRELSCNAYDAHVAANKADIPFEIHLPNKLEPWFAVKDFGIGLSNEDVLGLYTTYFESTKSDSNDFIGALGLGSKSPFSYTPTFEVIARFNGKRRTYTVFVNEDGVPSIVQLGEIATTETNGIEVKIAVLPQDFSRFRQRTATALRWFKTKPIVIGDPNFSFETLPATRISGTGWDLLPRYHSDPQITAVQGNVAYAVKSSHVEFDDSVRSIVETGHLVLHFNIGELEVAASREEIRYDQRTKDALIQHIGVFEKEFMANLEKMADETPKEFWYATIELNKISAKLFGSVYGLRKFISRHNGTQNVVLRQYANSEGSVPVAQVNGWDVAAYQPGSSWNRGRVHSVKRLTKREVGSLINPSSETCIFINDVKTCGVERIHQFMKESNVFNVAVTFKRRQNAVHITVNPDGTKTACPYTEKDYDADLQTLINGLGNPKVHYVSVDTKRVEKPKRVAKNKTTSGFKFNGTYDTRTYRRGYEQTRVKWADVPLDVNEGGVYFVLRNGKNIVHNFNGSVHEIEWSSRHVLSYLKTISQLITTNYPEYGPVGYADIVGVSSAMEEKLKKTGKWVNIFDLIINLAPKYATLVDFKSRIQETTDSTGVLTLIEEPWFVSHLTKLHETSKFRVILEPIVQGYKLLKTAEEEIILIRQICRWCNVNISTNTKPLISKNAFDCYPMLKFTKMSYFNQSNGDILFDYITTIDSKGEIA